MAGLVLIPVALSLPVRGPFLTSHLSALSLLLHPHPQMTQHHHPDADTGARNFAATLYGPGPPAAPAVLFVRVPFATFPALPRPALLLYLGLVAPSKPP